MSGVRFMLSSWYFSSNFQYTNNFKHQHFLFVPEKFCFDLYQWKKLYLGWGIEFWKSRTRFFKSLSSKCVVYGQSLDDLVPGWQFLASLYTTEILLIWQTLASILICLLIIFKYLEHPYLMLILLYVNFCMTNDKDIVLTITTQIGLPLPYIKLTFDQTKVERSRPIGESKCYRNKKDEISACHPRIT